MHGGSESNSNDHDESVQAKTTGVNSDKPELNDSPESNESNTPMSCCRVRDCQTVKVRADRKSDGVKEWTFQMQEAVVSACVRLLTHNTCRDLERRVRSGTGTELKISQKNCCGNTVEGGSSQIVDSALSCCANKDKQKSHDSCESNCKSNVECGPRTCEAAKSPIVPSSSRVSYGFASGPDDSIGRLLQDWTTAEQLKTIVGQVCERAARVYNGVVSKGVKDGLSIEIGGIEDRHLHDEVLREALVREVQLKVSQELCHQRLMDSREGGLLANPVGYTEGPLSFLDPDTIRDLMVDGIAVQKGFIGETSRRQILNELELLDFDGRFNEVLQQSMLNVRKDFLCWMTISDLDREKEQGMRHLLKCLFALPFELNKKANLCLQIGWVTQVSVFPPSGSFYRSHIDGGFKENCDNGRKITAIYYPNANDWSAADGGELKVYRRRCRSEQLKDESCVAVCEGEQPVRVIEPRGDVLVLFRSRDMPHEVLETHRKRFAISAYFSGPPGPGDD